MKEPSPVRLYWDLFFTFARVGALTFGGGPAMLPMFRHELVERKKWVDDETLVDYYAITVIPVVRMRLQRNRTL